MAKTKHKDTATGPRARNDAYVMMLFITFLAIVAGTVLMYQDHEEYGGKAPPPAPKIGEVSADAKTAGAPGGGGPAGVPGGGGPAGAPGGVPPAPPMGEPKG